MRQYRTATLQGHAPPLLSTSATTPTVTIRQRRRRTRGENGNFHLRGEESSSSIAAHAEQQATPERRPEDHPSQPTESNGQRSQPPPTHVAANLDTTLASSTSDS